MFGLTWRWALVAALLGSLGQTNNREQKVSLSDYLHSHPSAQINSGSMMVVDPSHTFAKDGGSTLLSFQRMSMAIGSLTAIVPTEMVLIDDSLTDAPNFYDGLPRRSRLLYLLSTLSGDQLKTANSDGIGLSDLQGEQRKVFESILPRPLTWEADSLDSKGKPAKTEAQGSVPDAQMDQVKIKIYSSVCFDIMFADHKHGLGWLSSNNSYGKPGDLVNLRTDSGRPEEGGFGIDPHRSVPNKQKPSQLNYAEPRFLTLVSVPEATTIKDLLKVLASGSGVEIYADRRIADLPVKFVGGQAKVCDVLKGIALSVTGTFRRVDSAFVLTSDLMGMGARKLKFCVWADDLDKELNRRERLWRSQINKSGALSKLGFDPKDPLAPGDGLGGMLSQNLRGDTISVGKSDLTPSMGDFLQQFANSKTAGEAMDLNKFGVSSELVYQFILPDGKLLHAESGSLGERGQFAFQEISSHIEIPKIGPFGRPNTARHKLVIRAETKDTALTEVQEAAKHGFTEIWLETHDPAALAGVVRQGVTVKLVIRPWEAVHTTEVSKRDTNLLGETRTQLDKRLLTEPAWEPFRKLADNAGAGLPQVYDFSSPPAFDPSQPWTKLMSVARNPGLQGIIVLDSQPAGYEANVGRVKYGGYEPWLAVASEFGYSQQLRLGFLRDYCVDPIDIASSSLELPFNIEQPFFVDDSLGARNSSLVDEPSKVQHAEQEWASYRSRLNKESIFKLLEQVGNLGLPVLIQPRCTATHSPPYLGLGVIPWSSGQTIPQFDPASDSQPSRRIKVFKFDENSTVAEQAALDWYLKSATTTIALDVSSVAPDRLHILLDTWFPIGHPVSNL